MSTYYASAIGIICDSNTNFRDLCCEIAKKNPAALVQAYARLQSSDDYWRKECIELMRANRKIDAIKLCRNMTGKSLADSKFLVESLPL